MEVPPLLFHRVYKPGSLQDRDTLIEQLEAEITSQVYTVQCKNLTNSLLSNIYKENFDKCADFSILINHSCEL